MKAELLIAGIMALLPMGALNATASQSNYEMAVGPISDVSIEWPVGEVAISGSAGKEVSVDMELTCERRSKRCAAVEREVKLHVYADGSTLKIEVEHWPEDNDLGLHGDLRIDVPKNLDVSLELAVGKVDIDGMKGDLDLEVGVGAVEIKAPRAELSQVAFETGVGSISVQPQLPGAQTSQFITSSYAWSGESGMRVISAEVGVGEVELRMMD